MDGFFKSRKTWQKKIPIREIEENASNHGKIREFDWLKREKVTSLLWINCQMWLKRQYNFMSLVSLC